VRVREACAEDVPACARLRAAWSGGDADDFAGSMLRDVTSPERLLLVADAGAREVVGYGRASRFSHPPDARPDVAPEGWYLIGLIVDEAWRQRGVGRALTVARLEWLREQAAEVVWCFTGARNAASIALHDALGFREVTRDFSFPGATFEGGVGVLLRLDLRD
jgi:ribosomal protein S18 acetylase RimI-like enzyme